MLLKYLVRNTSNGELSTDFASLTKAVNNLVDKGSVVRDEIGKDFDFVNNPAHITLQIGKDTLTAVKVDDDKYGFGKKADGTYRYELIYNSTNNNASENLELKINETINPKVPVQLVYYEKLVNVPKKDGRYVFDVNEKAILIPMDSNGNKLEEIEFPVPRVTLQVKNPVVTFINEDSEYAKVKVEKAKSISGDSFDTESMPVNPSNEGYVFKEWNTQKDGNGKTFDGDTIVDKDMTVYAIYDKKMEPIDPVSKTKKPTIKPTSKPASTSKPALRYRKTKVAETGDYSDLLLYSILFGLSVLGLSLVIVSRKKQKRSQMIN